MPWVLCSWLSVSGLQRKQRIQMAKAKKRGAAKVAARKATAKTKRTEAIIPKVAGKLAKLVDAVNDRHGVTGGMWKGEVVGDTVVGEVLAIKREDSKYRDGQLTMVLSTEEGTKTVWSNWSMEAALLNEGVNVGDMIAIQYKGDVPAGRGRPMKTYAVVRDGGKGKAHPLLTPQDNAGKKKRKRSRR